MQHTIGLGCEDKSKYSMDVVLAACDVCAFHTISLCNAEKKRTICCLCKHVLLTCRPCNLLTSRSVVDAICLHADVSPGSDLLHLKLKLRPSTVLSPTELSRTPPRGPSVVDLILLCNLRVGPCATE